MITLLISCFVVFLTTFLVIIYYKKYDFWKKRNVSTPIYLPILGNMLQLLTSAPWMSAQKHYERFKSLRFWGEYEGFNPKIWICDPSLLRDILVKDATHFIDRRTFKLQKHEEVFNEMLTVMTGQKWKSLRSILSPTFTSGKIKSMFPIIESKCNILVNEIEKDLVKNGYIDIKQFFGYYSMDVIAECAFGMDMKCLQDKNRSTFMKNGVTIGDFTLTQMLKFISLVSFPLLAKVLKLTIFKNGNFFVDLCQRTLDQREESGIKRGDFVDLMLEALEKSKKDENFKYPMTTNTIIANSVLFILAGFDTTSNALSFATYLLASNPECQKHLRKELQHIIETDGELNYQNIMEAEYLDACFSESLRLYPLGHTLERNCTQKYKLSGTDIEIPEGMLVAIPVWSLHRDPNLWDEPEKFEPERFLGQNKNEIAPFSYMPFGMGPRNCIGLRFAQLESKLALAKLCINFDIKMRPGHEQITLAKTMSSLRADKNGVQVVLTKIN